MAFDLDDEENEATRKMNGASKEKKEIIMDKIEEIKNFLNRYERHNDVFY